MVLASMLLQLQSALSASPLPPQPDAPPPPKHVLCALANGDRVSGQLVSITRTTVRIQNPALRRVSVRRVSISWCDGSDPVTRQRLRRAGLMLTPPTLVTSSVTAGVPTSDSIAPLPPLPIAYVTEAPLPVTTFALEPVVMPIAAALPISVEKVGWARTLDVGYGLSRGNANTTDLRFTGGAARRSKRSQVSLQATRRFGTREGEASVDFFQTTLRYDRALGPNDASASTRPSYFAETTFERDPFAKLRRRVLENTGFSIPLVPVGINNLALEVGLGMTHEQYEGLSARTRMGGLLRLAAKQKFGTTQADQQVSTFPDLAGPSVHYRLATVMNLAAPLNTKLALRLGLNNRYDTRPQFNVRKSDTTIQTGLGIKF